MQYNKYIYTDVIHKIYNNWMFVNKQSVIEHNMINVKININIKLNICFLYTVLYTFYRIAHCYCFKNVDNHVKKLTSYY